jgi:hypothetical protein
MSNIMPRNVDSARAIVEKIMTDNGGMEKKDWDATPEISKRAIRTLRRKLGASTQT